MDSLQAGVSRVDITPPLGICMEGSFRAIYASDVWENLYANAVVLDDGCKEVALVSVDVCSIQTQDFRSICRRIGELCQIPGDHVLVAATHTHSGPATGMDIDGIYDIDPHYTDQLIKKIASAVRLAQQRKQPTVVRAGRGENRDFLFNRRLKMPDGSVVMNWVAADRLRGAVSSDEIDPEVLLLRLDGADGRPQAYIVNVANHNNAAPGHIISADYSGIMADRLRQVYGDDLVVLFLPGAAGDVNWIDHNDPERYRDGLYKEIGDNLASTVLAVDKELEQIESTQLGLARRTARLAERPYRAYDIAVDATFGDPAGAGDFFDAYRQAYQRYKDQPLPEHEVDLWVLRLGERVGLCANPAELFAAYGLAIKRQSPCQYTFISELSNGLIGYVPTRRAFDEGGYEVRKVPGGSYMALETGEYIVETTLQLLGEAGG